jgi:hypothetical protein
MKELKTLDFIEITNCSMKAIVKRMRREAPVSEKLFSKTDPIKNCCLKCKKNS